MNLREAAQAALEALRATQMTMGDIPSPPFPWNENVAAIAALETALAAPEPTQEPVAWITPTTHKSTGEKQIWISTSKDGWGSMESVEYGEQVPLYAHPAPPQTPMTDKQIEALLKEEWKKPEGGWYDLIRAVERHHGIVP